MVRWLRRRPEKPAKLAEPLPVVERAAAAEAAERLTPLHDRLARLLATNLPDVQSDGLSLPTLQASLRARWRGQLPSWQTVTVTKNEILFSLNTPGLRQPYPA